jgi:hypothetical protein
VTKLIKAITMIGSTINYFATTKSSKGHLTEISSVLLTYSLPTDHDKDTCLARIVLLT